MKNSYLTTVVLVLFFTSFNIMTPKNSFAQSDRSNFENQIRNQDTYKVFLLDQIQITDEQRDKLKQLNYEKNEEFSILNDSLINYRKEFLDEIHKFDSDKAQLQSIKKNILLTSEKIMNLFIDSNENGKLILGSEKFKELQNKATEMKK